MTYPRVLLVSLLLMAFAAEAQVPPIGTNNKPPDAYFARMRSDPKAFSFGQSYLSLAAKIRENRNGILAAASSGGRMAVPSMMNGGIIVSGTKLIPIATALYSDMPQAPYAKSQLAAEFFDGPWNSGTMNNFYKEVSYGNLDVKGTVFDWQHLSQSAAWYSGDDYQDANGVTQPCLGLCPGSRVGQLITELLNKNPNVDWGQFDNDGSDKQSNSGDDDGYVDFIVIVHPGIGGECGVPGSKAIWSHRGQLESEGGAYVTSTPSATPGFGNIKVNDYVIVPALACDGVSQNPIGIVAHEFGHAFGLPDLYDVTYKTNGGVGDWDLMATGAWGGNDVSPSKPTHMSAWSKEYLGWVIPSDVTRDIADIALLPIAKKAMAYRVAGAGSKYFLFSNRQKTGYDALLPAAGLLIENIDEAQLQQGWAANQVNTNPTALGVQVIEADGTTGLIDPLVSGTAHRQAVGDIFQLQPVLNLDSNSNPSTPGPFALCGMHLVDTVIHAQLLVSTTTCPSLSPIAVSAGNLSAIADAVAADRVPGSGVRTNVGSGTGRGTQTSVDALLQNPAGYVGKKISLNGVIQNTGTNYFTNLHLTLTDLTGRSLPVSVSAPTELPPTALNSATQPHAGAISDYLGKSVTVTGTIVEKQVQGQGKVLVLNVTDVHP